MKLFLTRHWVDNGQHQISHNSSNISLITGVETENVANWYNDMIGVNYSNVNYGPWIVLSGSTSSNSTPVLGTSTIIADLTHNSDGQDISSLGHIPDGINSKFLK